jgi:hypothetical protein
MRYDDVKRWLATLAACAAAMSSFPASATLGGDAASVDGDRVAMSGTVSTASAASYTVHEIATPAGMAVKEFVSVSGKVFAVTWSGPAMPDLRRLLGAYFDAYEQAARAQRAGVGPVDVRAADLVVQSAGHMRAFFGRAYVTSLLPAGVEPGDLQ